VDKEIRRIIDEQYARARKIIEDSRDKVEVMTQALLDWETIDSKQIEDIMSGRPPRPPEDSGSPVRKTSRRTTARNRPRHRWTSRPHSTETPVSGDLSRL